MTETLRIVPRKGSTFAVYVGRKLVGTAPRREVFRLVDAITHVGLHPSFTHRKRYYKTLGGSGISYSTAIKNQFGVKRR